MRLAKPLDDYHELVVHALLFYDDAINDELGDMQEEWISAQEKTLGQRVSPHRTKAFDPHRPIHTGDPIADEWERQIAAGDLPDWLKGDPDGR